MFVVLKALINASEKSAEVYGEGEERKRIRNKNKAL